MSRRIGVIALGIILGLSVLIYLKYVGQANIVSQGGNAIAGLEKLEETAVSDVEKDLEKATANKSLPETGGTTTGGSAPATPGEPSPVCQSGESNRCYLDKALREKDDSYCAKIAANSTEEADSCHYSLALNTNNIALCDLISTDSSKYRCIATVGKKPEACSRIIELKARESCYAVVALKAGKVGICRNITSTAIRDQCLFDVTRKKPNPLECWSIVNQTLKDTCILEHVELNLINPALCYHINNTDMQKNCSMHQRVTINASSP